MRASTPSIKACVEQTWVLASAVLADEDEDVRGYTFSSSNGTRVDHVVASRVVDRVCGSLDTGATATTRRLRFADGE